MRAATGSARWIVVVSCLLGALAALASGAASGASSTSTVSVTVASATNIDASACASGTANVTDMGTMLPNTSSVTTGDCTVTFGSSNDSSQLRIAQRDGRGSAMWRPTSGALDTSFDTDGKTTIPIGAGNAADQAYAVAEQPDGKLVIAGSSYNGTNTDIAVIRLNADGSLDTTFDTDGKQTTNVQGNDVGYAVAVLPSGGIVVAGKSSPSGIDTDVALVKYTSAGALDTTFDTDGIVTTAISAGLDWARDIAVQSDGRLVVAGQGDSGANPDMLVARYNVNGSLDTSFDSDGYNLVGFVSNYTDYANSVAIQADGKIVAAGQYSNGSEDFGIIRLTTAGALDTTFDGDGRQNVDFGAGQDRAFSMAIQDDGKLALAGAAYNGVAYDHAFARLTTTGALDTTFSADGKQTYDLSVGVNDWATAVSVLPDGRMMTSGFVTTAGVSSVEVARLTASGALDTSFDTDGVLTTTIGGSDGANDAMVYDDGAYAVVGDARFAGPNYDFAAYRFSSVAVADYANAATDWDQGANTFGACLRAVAGGATAQWTASATCPATDGAYWNAIPSSATKIAYASTAGTTAATASLRFGMRTSTSQPPGAYMAPVTFDVLAPNT